MTLSVLRDITESTRLRKELEQISLTDDLTGLYNRRGFNILSERMITLARRQQANIFILFGDMDKLKWINDTLGHLEGDNAIRAMAGIFTRAFRESDLIARMGGDEFAVMGLINEPLVPETLIERLQGHIDEFNAKAGAKFKLALSIGIERLPCSSEAQIEEALHAADTKMYAAKEKKGRI